MSVVVVDSSAPVLLLLKFQVVGMHVSLKQVTNLFLQKDSTKCYEDCVSAVGRIRKMLGSTEETSPPLQPLIVGDKTYSFLRGFRKVDPQRNSWIRESPGDWHVMLHGGKAEYNRWRGASIEVVAETDDNNSDNGANNR